MKMTKEEKERRHYNKKLIFNESKTALRTPHKINWAELVLTAMGCFIGLLLIGYIEIETFINNIFVCFIIEALIVAVAIIISKIVFYALKILLKKVIDCQKRN